MSGLNAASFLGAVSRKVRELDAREGLDMWGPLLRWTSHRQPESGRGGLGTEVASGHQPSLAQEHQSYSLEELKSPSHVEAPGSKLILKA